MLKYAIKRLLFIIPLLLIISFLAFWILSLSSGDPVRMLLGETATETAIAAMREELGLDDPFMVRYANYMIDLFHGDFGISYRTGQPIVDELAARWPNTVSLGIVSIIIVVVISIPMGVIAAIKQNTWVDTSSMVFCLIGIAMPNFWLALLLLLAFSVNLNWLPSQGMGDWKNYILPSITLAFSSLAGIGRTTRSSMLETIRQDYIRTARSKGISKNAVIRKHALRNALIPMTTVIGMEMGLIVGGAVLTETVFAWPGIGRYMIQSIQGLDSPAVMACILLMAAAMSLITLAVDLLYGVIDPRVKALY